MKAMIFAAGLGTRLKPLTDFTPKPLLKVGSITLLEYSIRKLVFYGFDSIIINVHHLFDQIISFLKSHNNFNIDIQISDESELLLDTGGGLRKAKAFFNKSPFLVYNCDILSNINLRTLYEFHLSNNASITLAVRKRETSRYLLFNDKNRLCGWLNKKNGQKIIISPESQNLKEFAFSGIHIINPQVLELMPEKLKFSLVDFYLDIAAENKINAFDHSETFWIDIGKTETYNDVKSLDPFLYI